jgi:two-component system KDP operon response regulator KdpE
MADAAGARILVIDDETQIRRFLAISLRAQGYEVAEAATGLEGLESLATRGADLVVLDLGLPDLDGIEVLQDLRAWSMVPVVVLSVRASEDQKVAALDAGANDYVTKPFGVQELSARLRALLRLKPEAERSPVYDDGHLRVDLALRQVHVAGAPAALSRKEWALLALLMRHAGRVVTQPQLLRELWGPSHEDDTHYLRILVAKLRAKLGEDASAPRYLHTEPGVGLRFSGQA